MLNIRKFLEGIRLIPKSSASINSAGEIEFLSSTNKLNLHNGTSSSPVVTEAHSATLTNKTIDADNNTITNIENADIKAGAAIDAAKIADGSVSNAEFQYLGNVTSDIQTQLNGKQASGSYITALTGDVTATGPGSSAASIAANAVSNSKLAQMTQATIKGRADSSGTGDPVDLTGTQATAILDTFTSSLKGLAPASGGGTTNFLRADGTWTTPAGASSPLTTKGDLWGYSTLDARVPVGTNGQVLTADSTQTLGIKWASPSTPQYYTGTAGETLATNDAVYISMGATDGGRTAGSIYKLDATNVLRSTFLGFVVTGVSSGATVTIQVVGELTGFSSLIQGQPVYASVSSAGSYQTSKPASTEGATVILGWGGTATTKLLINAGMGLGTNLVQYTAGFDVGGFNTVSSHTNTYQKLVFATEATSTLSTTLNVSLAYAAGVSSSTKGYTLGGNGGAGDFVNNWVLTFASETSAAGTNLASARRGASPTQSSTAGYGMGGNGDSSIAKVVFSSGATSNLSATLNIGGDPSYNASTTSSTAGYATGGSSLNSTITKLVHATDTTSNLSATTSAARRYTASSIHSTGVGYWMGGNNGSNLSSIEALNFAAETMSTLAATTSSPGTYNSGASAVSYGYAMAGITNAEGSGSARIDKLDFVTETRSSAANTLPNARQGAHGGSGLRY